MVVTKNLSRDLQQTVETVCGKYYYILMLNSITIQKFLLELSDL